MTSGAPVPPGDRSPDARTGRRTGPAMSAGLVLTALLFAVATDWPWPFAVELAVAGTLGAVGARASSSPVARRLALLPALVALGALGVRAPPTAAADLFGGVAGIALLAWLAADPTRAPGGVARAALPLALAFATVGIAWAGAFFLPPGTALVGVGAALLVLVTVVLAFLFGRPDLFDRRPAATD